MGLPILHTDCKVERLRCVFRFAGSDKTGLFSISQFKWCVQGGRHRRQQRIPRDNGTSPL